MEINMANPRGKFTFEGRNALVREQILKRLKGRDAREDTFTGPDDDGREPFLDAFERYPDAPYIICLAHGIVDSWLVSDPIITEGEYFVGFMKPTKYSPSVIIGSLTSHESTIP